MKKIAIVTTHPIQYNAPIFQLLTARGNVGIKVFYTWGEAVNDNKFDPGFGKIITWDLPLLEGYEYNFVENIAADPGSHHFNGIINPTLNDEIKTWNPDALLVYGWGFQSHLKCLRYFHKKIPVLFRGDSTLLDEKGGIQQFVRRLFLKWVYRHVDVALYVGNNNKKYFLAHGLKPAQLIEAPHAIDNDRFGEPDELYQIEAVKIRENLGISEHDLVLLFAGKMETKKNPLFLVQLLNIIKDKRLKVLFVGNGPLFPQIKSAAALDDRILLMEFQNQQSMPAVYRVADMFILPSTGPGETWGLSLNEAMAAGKVVVASNKTGGAMDLIEEGVNGLMIDLKDNETLLTLIQHSLINKDRLIEMGKQSRIKIQLFNFSNIATAIEKVVKLPD